MNKKGIVLLLGLMVITVLTVLGTVVISRSISESRAVQRHVESTQAFWLAEAAVNQALKALRISYSTSSVAGTIGSGRYSATITSNADGSRTITAHGFVPASNSHVERKLEITANKFSPSGFYDNTLCAAGNVAISGSSYSIVGDVTYAGTISSTSNITGTVTHDPSISPLAALDFTQLRTISQSQSNYHSASQLSGPFPASFWYNETLGIPNVVFLEGNLTLHGNSSVAGFFVVGGEVTYDATLSGNVAVIGCIYTRGNLTINGGGNALNIDGGVWVGSQTTLHGGVALAYNQTYMDAVENLHINTNVQLTSWKDLQNPYVLTP
jgi:cytoskeletal protein CcmA (bactofilin family)